MANGTPSYYDERDTVSFEERRRNQVERIIRIVRHAYESAPAIRAKMDEAGVGPGDIRSLKDLEKIPITTKDDLVGMQKRNPPFGGIVTVPPNRLQSICMSPGPIYNTPGNDDTYLGRVGRAYFGCGLRPGDILVNTFSYHVSPMGILLDTPLKRFGVTVIPMGGGNKQLQAQVLKDLQATVFTGTAGFLLEILRTAETMGYDPKRDFALRLAITPLDHGLMKVIEKDYGIRVTEFYGTADVGIVAYNCDERMGMHFCEDVIVEIVDINTGIQLGPGKVGRVVLTPLDDTVPLIRFGPGDLSSWIDQPCSCGRTSYRINPITGWMGEAVKVRGMFLHPTQLASVVGTHAGIEKYRLVCRTVDGKDFLAFLYEEAEGMPQRGAMEDSFRVAFRDVCRLNLDRIECVPRGALEADAKPIADERPPGGI